MRKISEEPRTVDLLDVAMIDGVRVLLNGHGCSLMFSGLQHVYFPELSRGRFLLS